MKHTPEHYQAFIKAVRHPNFSHCSKRGWCGASFVHAYHKCSNSPSGVFQACSLNLTDDIAIAIVHGLGVMPNYTGPQRGDLALSPHR